MEWLAFCLEELSHTPVRWDNPGLFPPGEGTLPTLIEISKTVDAAAFIFSEDDHVWYRGDAAQQPRDNVLIEWGLFAGQLGPRKCIVCIDGEPKTATDILGLTLLDISERRRSRARIELRVWLSRLTSQPIDANTLQLMAKLEERDRELDAAKRRLAFEAETREELENLLTREGVLDFAQFDFSADGHWKLLFDFEYFWGASEVLERECDLDPTKWRALLIGAGATQIADRIQWSSIRDKGRAGSLVRKGLRLFRGLPNHRLYADFLGHLSISARQLLDNVGKASVARRRRAFEPTRPSELDDSDA